jgi:PIN domain nuclease of toxin-antitoxin system
VLRLASLPPIHADPFDRMLVAQALEDGLTLVTGDPIVQSYGVDFIW